MKKVKIPILFLFILLTIPIRIHALELSTNNAYSYTLNSENESYDYLGTRISILIPTSDSQEVSYGPYVGIFYNYKLVDYDFISDAMGISLGLNMKYNTPIIQELGFLVTAFGGVHSEDLFKTFNTEILVNIGVNYKNFYITVGYETRYYPTDIIVNYLPITIGVNYKF